MHDRGGGRGEFVGLRLEGLLQVQRIGGDGRASGLNLSPEILGLMDEEPVAVRQVGEDVLFQAEDLALLRLLVGGNEGSLQVFRGRV